MWDVYSDLAAMNSLLKEMMRDGVGFDEGTLGVLQGVRADMEADLGGGSDGNGVGRGEAWWSMRAHQEEFGKLDGYWREVVGKEIERTGFQDGEDEE